MCSLAQEPETRARIRERLKETRELLSGAVPPFARVVGLPDALSYGLGDLFGASVPAFALCIKVLRTTWLPEAM